MKIKLSNNKLREIIFRSYVLLFSLLCLLILDSGFSDSDWRFVLSLPGEIVGFFIFGVLFSYEFVCFFFDFCSYLYRKLRLKKKSRAAAPVDPEVQHEG